jgi:hypothetical protein
LELGESAKPGSNCIPERFRTHTAAREISGRSFVLIISEFPNRPRGLQTPPLPLPG